jgi:hypothetical protein
MSLSGRTRTAAEPVDLPVAEAQTWGAAAEFNPETITSGFGRIVVARRHLRVLATTPTAARPFTRLLRAPRHASVRS